MPDGHDATPEARQRDRGQDTDLSLTKDRDRIVPSRSQRWKHLERVAARKLGGKRIVREWLFEKAPDVVVPDFGLIIDCKAYRRFAHHTLLETAQRKYTRPGEHVALVTKHSGQVGEYITVPLDWFAAILDELRQAREGSA